MKVLKFAASWCGPCKMLSNILEDYKGPVAIEEIDIDKDQDIAIFYGIRGVPTCIFLDENGTEVRRKSGVMMLKEFEEFVKE